MNELSHTNCICAIIAQIFNHILIIHDLQVEYLLENGADPNQQANCGATALHYAAECGQVEICKLLLDYGGTLQQNEYGMSPVITAAERTRELVVELFYTRPNLLTVEEVGFDLLFYFYFFTILQSNCVFFLLKRLQKIDALELMGASFANDKDNYSLNKAYEYLMLAMESRYEDPKNIVRKCILPPVPAYENWIESQTIQDLQAIRLNHNSMHMESLTIRERILGRKCPDVAHPIVFRGAVCADNGRFDRCESLWLHALELRQNNELSVQRDLLRFAQVFSQMINVDVPLRLPNVLSVLSYCIKELEINVAKFKNPGPKDDLESVMEEFELNIITALYVCTIITKLLKLSAAQKSERNLSYKLVYSLMRMNLKLRDGQTLLHLAVNGVTPVDNFHTNDVCRFPCAETVQLFLMCGAKVAVLDCMRNSPLHTLTSTVSSIVIFLSFATIRNSSEL